MDNRDLIKCVIWDLDGTLWEGSLLENGAVELRPGLARIIEVLDSRGILQSVASKNDHEMAWPVLEALGLSKYFLHPQISWSGKAESVQKIAETLNIGLDAIAFIDDRIEERDEVRFFLPSVMTIDAGLAHNLLDMACFKPRFITAEARERRTMYQSAIARADAEEKFTGGRDAFLQTLGMQMSVSRATVEDLGRVEELTIRTNQLNATGRVYSYNELERLSNSADHLLLVAKLHDCYGSYGTIGLALIEKSAEAWTIRLLIMSCRVMTRGVGSIFLGHLLRLASKAEVALRADYVDTGRNRQMYVTYKFSGFRDLRTEGGGVLLEHDLLRINPYPSYISVTCSENS